jgi:hypothetical protein
MVGPGQKCRRPAPGVAGEVVRRFLALTSVADLDPEWHTVVQIANPLVANPRLDRISTCWIRRAMQP